MRNKLNISIRSLPENLPDGFDDNRNAWGISEFSVAATNNSSQQQSLLKVEWHMIHLVRWLMYSFCPRSSGLLPLWSEGEIVAKGVRRLNKMFFDAIKQDALNLYDRETFFRLQRFIKSHNISYGFPSVPVPYVYISSDGISGEISFEKDLDLLDPNPAKVEILEGSWAYKFDIEDFLARLPNEVLSFLYEWTATGEQPHAQELIEYAHNLLQGGEQIT